MSEEKSLRVRFLDWWYTVEAWWKRTKHTCIHWRKHGRSILKKWAADNKESLYLLLFCNIGAWIFWGCILTGLWMNVYAEPTYESVLTANANVSNVFYHEVQFKPDERSDGHTYTVMGSDVSLVVRSRKPLDGLDLSFDQITTDEDHYVGIVGYLPDGSSIRDDNNGREYTYIGDGDFVIETDANPTIGDQGTFWGLLSVVLVFWILLNRLFLPPFEE